MITRSLIAAAFLIAGHAVASTTVTAKVVIAETGAPASITATSPNEFGFTKLNIAIAGHTTTFALKNPVAILPSSKEEQLQTGLPLKIAGTSLDPSHLFFRTNYTAATPHTLLFFISEGGASDAAPFLAIGFHANGEPYKVLELEAFDPLAFLPTTRSILGNPTMSQVMGGNGGNGSKTPYATTYDPRAIYVIGADGIAHYSLSASETYNRAHYVWAGPKSREDYSVLYNISGHTKPFGAPASRVDALLHSTAATQ